MMFTSTKKPSRPKIYRWSLLTVIQPTAYLAIFAAVVAIVQSLAAPVKYKLSGPPFQSRGILTVTTVLIEPYAMAITKPNSASSETASRQMSLSDSRQYEGYIIDLMDRIASIVGFKYQILPAGDGHFGYKQNDGSWNGIIGELMRKEADIGAAPLVVTKARRQVVDFCRPFMTVEASLLVSGATYRRYFRPGFTVRDVVVVADAHQRQPSAPDDVDYHGRDGGTYHRHDAAGGSLLPPLRFGTLNRGILHRALKRSNDTVYKAIYDSMTVPVLTTTLTDDGTDPVDIDSGQMFLGGGGGGGSHGGDLDGGGDDYGGHNRGGFTDTNEEGVERARNSDDYAFIVQSEIAAYLVGRRPCDLVAVDRFLVREDLALAVDKGSHLLSYINQAISFMRVGGEFEQLYRKWWTGRNQCSPTGSGGTSPVGNLIQARGSASDSLSHHGTAGSGDSDRIVSRSAAGKPTSARSATISVKFSPSDWSSLLYGISLSRFQQHVFTTLASVLVHHLVLPKHRIVFFS